MYFFLIVSILLSVWCRQKTKQKTSLHCCK